MATSGVTGFSLDVAELIDEAWERAGFDKQKVTADHLQSARRSVNLALQSWSNVQERPWSVEQDSFITADGYADEKLPVDTIDILEATLKRDDYEIPMIRISRSEYHALPDKTIEGRPDRFFLHRDRSGPVIYLYQTPENSTDEVIYWRIRELETVTAYNDTPDILNRWQDALCAETARRVHAKLPRELRDVTWQTYLDNEAVKAFDLALVEDRDRAPLIVVPANPWGGM